MILNKLVYRNLLSLNTHIQLQLFYTVVNFGLQFLILMALGRNLFDFFNIFLYLVNDTNWRASDIMQDHVKKNFVLPQLIWRHKEVFILRLLILRSHFHYGFLFNFKEFWFKCFLCRTLFPWFNFVLEMTLQRDFVEVEVKRKFLLVNNWNSMTLDAIKIRVTKTVVGLSIHVW